MKWTESTVVKLLLTQIPNVDPVTVFLENFGEGRGKLTIETCGEAWSSYWGAMGSGYTLEKFILACDNHYLSKNLATLSALSEPDYDGFLLQAKRHIIQERLTGAIGKDCARDKWNRISSVSPEKGYFDQESNWDTLAAIAGEEWYYDIPQKDSMVYNQLRLILDALKTCLKERGINLKAASRSKVMASILPNVGDKQSESQLIALAKLEGYTFDRVGNPVNSGMLLLLSQSNMPIGMSFLLVSAEESVFQRVY